MTQNKINKKDLEVVEKIMKLLSDSDILLSYIIEGYCKEFFMREDYGALEFVIGQKDFLIVKTPEDQSIDEAPQLREVDFKLPVPFGKMFCLTQTKEGVDIYSSGFKFLQNLQIPANRSVVKYFNCQLIFDDNIGH